MDKIKIAIIGAGVSGLSVAQFLGAADSSIEPMIFESSSRSGGAIRTLNQGEYQAEWGAHGLPKLCLPSRNT